MFNNLSRVFTLALACVLVAGMVWLGSQMGGPTPNAYGAPGLIPFNAQLTPVANGYPLGSAKSINMQNTTPVAADVTKCTEMKGLSVVDLQYVIKPNGVNTTTLTQYYTNDGTYYTTGPTIRTGTALPANTPVANMAQYSNFGRYFCVNIDVSNATPVMVKLDAVGH